MTEPRHGSSGGLIEPHEMALLYGPDGKTKVKAPKPEEEPSRRELRRQERRLCQKCGEYPHSRRLPNKIRVCLRCYFDANPQGAKLRAASAYAANQPNKAAEAELRRRAR